MTLDELDLFLDSENLNAYNKPQYLFNFAEFDGTLLDQSWF